MSGVGDEQKIRTLFHDLRLEQQQLTPHFAAMWYRARLGTSASTSSWSLSLAVLSSVVVISVCSVGIWKNSQRSAAEVVATSPNQQSLQQTSVPDSSSSLIKSARANSRHDGGETRSKLAAGRTKKVFEKRAENDRFVAVARWESPTDYLLHSPADEILTLVPELGQAIDVPGQSKTEGDVR